MKEQELNFEWCASWEQDGRFYCTLFCIGKWNRKKFNKEVMSQFSYNDCNWRYDAKTSGVEVWFKKKQDMLTFKMITSPHYMTV